jgi:hypothetical protein
MLSLAVAIASPGLLSVAPVPSVSATPTPTPKPATSTSKTSTKDPCESAKSKWAHAECESYNASAPGDEYFGRMKISYLGIDNTYKDGAVSAGDYTTDPHLIAKIDFATEALRRWAAKYPNDPQLARSYFLGVIVMRKVYTQAEQDMAWQFMHILVTKYPKTYFGKTTKTQMAGFTEHVMGEAEPCPTPLPRGAKPEPSPSETPSPAPVAGHPPVEVVTPPCVQPSPSTNP